MTDTDEQNTEAPYGRKKDGTPRKRPGRAARRAVPQHNVLEQTSPDREHRPVNVRTRRRSRLPADGRRRRLRVGRKDPNYVYRWVVDEDGGDRMREFYQDMDYDFVRSGSLEVTSEDMGSNISQVANKSVGGQRHYLMAKPRQMYEEDQEAKQRRNDATDEMLRTNRRQQGQVGSPLPTVDDPNYYVPNT